jgi:O-acetyl-ADP-ribose deacetylase
VKVEKMVGKTKLALIQGDITQQQTDAIVNAANSSLLGGGGVDGAIHRAGGPAILDECKKIVAKIGRLPAGQAVMTTGGKLRAKYVIHTVGPVWRGGNRDESKILASAYRESLKRAVDKGLESVSFPSISTGAYGYPVDQAARVALETVREFLLQETTLKEIVSVQASNESAANSRVKPGAPVGPARMVLAVPDETARGRKPVLRDEVAAVVTNQQYPRERLREVVFVLFDSLTLDAYQRAF